VVAFFRGLLPHRFREGEEHTKEEHPDSGFCLCDNSELPKPNLLYSLKTQAQVTCLIFEILNHYKNGPTVIPGECFNRIYMAGCVLEPKEFERQLEHSKHWAFEYRKDPINCLYSICDDIYTPEINEQYCKTKPTPDVEKFKSRYGNFNPQRNPNPLLIIPPTIETPEETKPGLRLIGKPFSLKIAIRLCIAWRADPRWEKLFPCSKECLYRLIFRTYRKDTFRKIKQALANGETYFPWCLTGIKSLSKQLTYKPRTSTAMKNYKERQIRKGLRQLWDLGFIHRIFRGYEEKGAGKYHIFLNPRMSARFNKSSIDVKRGSTQKKRHSRMS